MRRTTGHGEPDHTLGLLRIRERLEDAVRRRRAKHGGTQQGSEGDAAKTTRGFAEESTPI
jgi:hypothetical protein